MAIIKYAPFNGFEPFPALKAFEDTMNRLFVEPNGRPWVPPVDIRETENELVVKADIPDVKFEDIDVRMENGTLSIKGERHFERVFTLPDTVNPDGVKADYKNGTLTITLPKKELAKPKQVKVQVSNN
jgi:HSP20 family protein